MAEEKKGFFKRLVSGLTKTRENIVSSMMTSMKKLKRFLLWEIWESMQPIILSKI